MSLLLQISHNQSKLVEAIARCSDTASLFPFCYQGLMMVKKKLMMIMEMITMIIMLLFSSEEVVV